MKYLYSIFIILCSHIVFSQDLQYTIDYLNKIYEEERIFFDSKNHYSEDFAPGNGYNEIIYIDSIVPKDTRCKYLDRRYEKQVLDYLEKFMYDSLPNIRKITYEFIYSVGNYSRKKKIRQRAVYMLLKMAYSPLVDIDNIIRFNKEDFNKKAKERLKDIIRGKKTQAEIDFLVNYEMKELLSNKFLDNQVEYICKKDSFPYELVRDSIYEHTRKKEIKYVTDWVPGHRLIELAGKIYMYDFVPELKEMLDDKRYSGEQRSDIKYALA